MDFAAKIAALARSSHTILEFTVEFCRLAVCSPTTRCRNHCNGSGPTFNIPWTSQTPKDFAGRRPSSGVWRMSTPDPYSCHSPTQSLARHPPLRGSSPIDPSVSPPLSGLVRPWTCKEPIPPVRYEPVTPPPVSECSDPPQPVALAPDLQPFDLAGLPRTISSTWDDALQIPIMAPSSIHSAMGYRPGHALGRQHLATSIFFPLQSHLPASAIPSPSLISSSSPHPRPPPKPPPSIHDVITLLRRENAPCREGCYVTFSSV
ncbi:hypothetical protein DPX16_18037 [Anabarilius grahami]|uniref:Uncharacterized protein n=1 Tax=Anabarilius grahami TaxID=495550 RepID=A0A3N0XT45_ANAGA|nr:hypothetical protein DPX16_18037 [Anabarilius grahami]